MTSVALAQIEPSYRDADRAETASDGEYELLDLLGRGGMSSMYLARHRTSGRRVALKLVAPGQLEHLSGRARVAVQRQLLREARAVSAVSHPNVIEFLDAGLMGGSVFIVMELIEGGSLADLLEVEVALPWPEAAAMGAMIAAGVAAAHAMGILHRELKPGNVMLMPGEVGVTAKVFDFGVAELLERVHGLILPGTGMGTPHYMSPEQCRGDVVDHRSDIYSLGVLLYRALAGRCPFEGTDHGEVMRLHEEVLPQPLDIEGLPPRFAQLVATCLAKDPDERFATMHEVALALDGLHGGDRKLASRPAGNPAPSAPIADAQGSYATGRVAVQASPRGRGRSLHGPVAAVADDSTSPRGRWAVRAAAGTMAIVVVLLAWLSLRPELPGQQPPPVVVVLPPAASVSASSLEPEDVASTSPGGVALAGLSACWGRTQASVERRSGRAMPVRTAIAFVATCFGDRDEAPVRGFW